MMRQRILLIFFTAALTACLIFAVILGNWSTAILILAVFVWFMLWHSEYMEVVRLEAIIYLLENDDVADRTNEVYLPDESDKLRPALLSAHNALKAVCPVMDEIVSSSHPSFSGRVKAFRAGYEDSRAALGVRLYDD